MPQTTSVEEQALGNPGSEMSPPSSPKMCHAFSRYRKYLHSYYNRNPIVRDDKLSIAPCSEFINLALVKEDGLINSFTQSTLHGGVDEIKKSKIPVGMDAIVTSDVKCNPELMNERITLLFKKSKKSIPFQISTEDRFLLKPQFTTFGYFVAGIIGCNVFKFDRSHVLSFVIMCMYEAQDCSQLSDQSQYTCIIPSNPMEMYAFGYVLVHAPIQWHLHIHAMIPPFDILASSLSDHASSIDQIQGSIVGITISVRNFPTVDPRLLLPPEHLLLSTITFHFACFDDSPACSMLCQMLPGLVNVQDIAIYLRGDNNQDDYLLYEFLRHSPIKNLELSFQNITLKGMQELFTTLSSSCTIEKVKLVYTSRINRLSALPRLVEAALSCSSVKSLETNIPFHILPTQHHIETMIFSIPMIGNPAVLWDCLLCIAEMCRVQSMNTLKITEDSLNRNIPHHVYRDFLCILNDSLHQNPYMCDLDIASLSNTQTCIKLEELPHIIRKGRVNVRRTKSLPDIATAIPMQPLHIPFQSGPNSVPEQQSWEQKLDEFDLWRLIGSLKDTPEDDGGLQHSKSCWSLLSLHNIHPLLHEALFPLKYRTPEPLPVFNTASRTLEIRHM